MNISIGKIRRSCNISLEELKHVHTSGNLKSKIFIYWIDIDRIPDFENIKIVKSNCYNYKSKLFLEGLFARLHKIPLNEACTITQEYVVIIRRMLHSGLLFQMHILHVMMCNQQLFFMSIVHKNFSLCQLYRWGTWIYFLIFMFSYLFI